MIVQYQFQAFQLAPPSTTELWACEIPAGHLIKPDEGAIILVDGHPREILAGVRRWRTLQGVGHTPKGEPGSRRDGDPPSTHLWIDGVDHTLDPERQVWLGYHPQTPDHLQRGVFNREIPDPPSDAWDFSIAGISRGYGINPTVAQAIQESAVDAGWQKPS